MRQETSEETGDSDTDVSPENSNPVMEMDTHEEVINADSNAAPRNPLSDFEHAAGTNISMGINSMTANNTQNELEEVTLGNHITSEKKELCCLMPYAHQPVAAS